jgi:hypothetical protein
MYYTDLIGQILSQLNSFLSNNQILLTTALLIGAYFLKRLIDAKAANPQQDIWDSIKPGSDALYALAHRGVEYLGKSKGLDKAAKLLEYLKIIEQFERDWQTDRIAAVKRLAAWYLSMQGKQVAANPSTEPLTADSVAVEESSKT